MHKLANLSHDAIRQRLKPTLAPTHDLPRDALSSRLRKAAVLIPFVQQDGEWHILFIQRTEHEKDRHSGQVAFAGGRYEEGDESLEMTALREAHEEVGIEPAHVRILGELNHHYSISNYEITPIVATIPWPYTLTLQSSEVAAAFTIPLRWLADPQNHSLEYRQFNGADIPVVYFKKYNGYLLWGATARMTISLLTLLKDEA
ncbi:MAG: coenzyme A pyrophosphatase [Proteobacteria bacterium]|nr:MAG: coenzyme A pyrophosphatase [Pseudomonadota bacterium]